VAWSSGRAAPLVVTAVVAAYQQAVEASQQAAFSQVAAVAPRQAIKEAAPLSVLAPLWPRKEQIGMCRS
jgi:hypothetical protein